MVSFTTLKMCFPEQFSGIPTIICLCCFTFNIFSNLEVTWVKEKRIAFMISYIYFPAFHSVLQLLNVNVIQFWIRLLYGIWNFVLPTFARVPCDETFRTGILENSVILETLVHLLLSLSSPLTIQRNCR